MYYYSFNAEGATKISMKCLFLISSGNRVFYNDRLQFLGDNALSEGLLLRKPCILETLKKMIKKNDYELKVGRTLC